MKTNCFKLVSVISLAVLLQGNANADATPVELDAAVARMSSATYKVELFAACGYSMDKAELQKVRNFAQVLALQKDDLSKKLTNDQFVSAALRVMDKDLAASIHQRAQADAASGECEQTANKELWEQLSRFAKAK
jgi:hypothetical protein